MGIFSTLDKARKTISGSKLWEKATKIARDVKTVAKGFISGIAGKDGIIAQAYGKVKSWGTLALGSVFPNMDDETLTSLQSVTSSSAAAGGPQFAGTFSNSLKTASGQVVSANPSITGKIKAGLSGIHSDIKVATSNMYDSSVEFITGKPKTKNPGQWVVDKAKTSSGISIKRSPTPVSGFIASDDIYNAASTRGISELVGKPAIPMDLMKQPLNVQYKTAEDLAKLNQYDPKILEKSRDLGVSPFAGIVGGMKAGEQPAPMILAGDKSNIYQKKSLLDSAKNFLSDFGPSIGAGFEAFGDLSQPYVPGRAARADNLSSQRQGIGGRGSAGGDFLSQAQQAFLSKQRSELERLG